MAMRKNKDAINKRFSKDDVALGDQHFEVFTVGGGSPKGLSDFYKKLSGKLESSKSSKFFGVDLKLLKSQSPPKFIESSKVDINSFRL
jgi:hypothetical protein